MLKPEYFQGKEERILSLYQKLEDFILKDTTRCLLGAGEMTSTADRLIYKLQMMGESREEIQRKLSEMTGLTREELRAILQDAVLTSWEDDASTLRQLGVELSNPLENAVVIRAMDAEYKKSLGELTNLTRTTMEQSQIDLINMLDEADMRVASGVQSYSAAVCDILDRYAGKGIEVSYPTGTKRTLEAAVRCCVVTSMNQTAAQVTNQYIVEAQSEYVLVSAHLGARTQPKGQPALAGHDNWQGRVYRIVGSEPEYPNLLESTGYDIEPGTGVGKVVNPLGLHGYNCRHSHKPWDIRLRNPYVDENGNLKINTEENKKQYELMQKQRAMERNIRKTKRLLTVKQEQIDSVAETDVKSILQDDYDKLAADLARQNQAYNDFCKENNLQPQYDRLKTADFGRKQEKAARDAVNNKDAIKDFRDTRKEYDEQAQRLSRLEKESNSLFDEYNNAANSRDAARLEKAYNTKYGEVESFRQIVKDLKATLSGKEAKAVRQIEKNLSIKMGVSVDKVNMKGLPYDSANMIFEGYKKVLNKYPELRGHLTSFTYTDIQKGNAYAGCIAMTGKISTYKPFSDFSKLKQSYAHDVATGFHPLGTDHNSIIVHELGHALDGYMTKKGLYGGKVINGGNIRSAVGVQKEVLARLGYVAPSGAELKKQGYTFSQINDIIIKDKEDFITQQVSRYACGKNIDGTKYTDFPENEFFAECFAEYLMSDNPRRAAQIFGQIIDDALGH